MTACGARRRVRADVTRLPRRGPRVAVLQDSAAPAVGRPCLRVGIARRAPPVCVPARPGGAPRRFGSARRSRGSDGIRVIDPTNRYCLSDVCPAVIGDVVVYRDSGHVTASYVESLPRGSGGTCRRHGAQEPAHDDRDARLHDTASTGGRRFARPGRAPGSAPRRRRACAPISYGRSEMLTQFLRSRGGRTRRTPPRRSSPMRSRRPRSARSRRRRARAERLRRA